MYKCKYRCKPEMIFTKQLWRKLATFTCGLHILSVFFIIKNDFHELFPQLSKRKRINNLHANSQIHVEYSNKVLTTLPFATDDNTNTSTTTIKKQPWARIRSGIHTLWMSKDRYYSCQSILREDNRIWQSTVLCSYYTTQHRFTCLCFILQ